jgi:hypothetical protein
MLLAIGIAAGPAVAGPNLVQNGQFLSTTLSSPGGYVCNTVSSSCVSTVTGWGADCSAQGVCGNGGTPLSLLFAGTGGVAFNSFNGLNVTLPDSPGGGNIIGDDGDVNYRAPLFQTISGLTVGATYNLSFYQAAAQQGSYDSDTGELWQVSLGGDLLNSALMLTPGGQFTAWNLQSMTFVATSTSELLNFLSLGMPAGEPPVALLADVSLTAAPEPRTIAVLSVGLLGLLTVARLRSRRTR